MMRILFVLHDFLETNFAGTELHTYYLAKNLQQGAEVHLFYNLEDRQQPLGITQGFYETFPVTRINYPATTYNDYAPKPHRDKITKAFERLLGEFRPNIIHFQHLLHLTPELVNIAFRRKIPTLYTLHDYWLLCHQIKLLRNNYQRCQQNGSIKCTTCHFENLKKSSKSVTHNGLKKTYWRLLDNYRTIRYYSHQRFQESRIIFNNIDLFISPSRFLREIFTSNGLPDGKITVIENGIPLIKTIARPVANHLRFGYIGGLNKEKGLHILVQAFASINDAELRIYGAINTDIARQLAQSNDNPNVHFCGPVTGPQKDQALSAIDVMIAPSIWYENAPLAIQEAYSVGCPVIASDIGGMAEFVTHGVSGWHFRTGDASDLRGIINRLIKNPQLVHQIRQTLPKARTVEDNAHDMKMIYHQLISVKYRQSQ